MLGKCEAISQILSRSADDSGGTGESQMTRGFSQIVFVPAPLCGVESMT